MISAGLRPDPARGAYSAAPDPLAVFKGVYFYGEEPVRRRGGGKDKGKERGERCREEGEGAEGGKWIEGGREGGVE